LRKLRFLQLCHENLIDRHYLSMSDQTATAISVPEVADAKEVAEEKKTMCEMCKKAINLAFPSFQDRCTECALVELDQQFGSELMFTIAIQWGLMMKGKPQATEFNTFMVRTFLKIREKRLSQAKP
jgi:hypothetical protein